jgi:hypothetical protein
MPMSNNGGLLCRRVFLSFSTQKSQESTAKASLHCCNLAIADPTAHTGLVRHCYRLEPAPRSVHWCNRGFSAIGLFHPLEGLAGGNASQPGSEFARSPHQRAAYWTVADVLVVFANASLSLLERLGRATDVSLGDKLGSNSPVTGPTVLVFVFGRCGVVGTPMAGRTVGRHILLQACQPAIGSTPR